MLDSLGLFQYNVTGKFLLLFQLRFPLKNKSLTSFPALLPSLKDTHCISLSPLHPLLTYIFIRSLHHPPSASRARTSFSPQDPRSEVYQSRHKSNDHIILSSNSFHRYYHEQQPINHKQQTHPFTKHNKKSSAFKMPVVSRLFPFYLLTMCCEMIHLMQKAGWMGMD